MFRNNRIIKTAALFFAVFLFLFTGAFSSGTLAPAPAFAASKPSVTTKVKAVDSEGNLVLKISRKQLYKAGFSKRDLVKVRISGRDYVYILPVYSGDPIFGKSYLNVKNKTVKITRSKRSFAGREKLKKFVGKKVKIRLYKAGGYRMKSPTQEIADYANDPYTFANFRNVTGGSLGENVLFRSHCPVTSPLPYLYRNSYADTLMQKHAVNTVLTLNLNANEMNSNLNPQISPYYSQLFASGNVSAVKMDGNKINSKAFRKAMKKHLLFMAEHEGPYLVHCAIGRDRTGFVICLLQALMGATYEELAEDYVQTYRNYNHVKAGTALDKYLKTSINDSIQTWTQGSKYKAPEKVNLRKAAKNYMKKTLHLTDAQINQIIRNLKKDYAPAPEAEPQDEAASPAFTTLANEVPFRYTSQDLQFSY